MGVDAGIELDLYTEVQSAFEDVVNCEHTMHNEYKDGHEGDAKWYLSIKCPNCDNTVPVLAVCDRWKFWVVDMGTSVTCGGYYGKCGKTNKDWLVMTCEEIRK